MNRILLDDLPPVPALSHDVETDDDDLQIDEEHQPVAKDIAAAAEPDIPRERRLSFLAQKGADKASGLAAALSARREERRTPEEMAAEAERENERQRMTVFGGAKTREIGARGGRQTALPGAHTVGGSAGLSRRCRGLGLNLHG